MRVPPSAQRAIRPSLAEPSGVPPQRANGNQTTSPRPPSSSEQASASALVSPGESAPALQLRRTVAQIKAHLDEAAAAFPSEGQLALKQALSTSAERVLVSLDLGRVTPDEAERALKMLAEMTDALVALEHGRVQVRPCDDYGNSDLRGFDVKTTTGDVLRVAVRSYGNEQGEARLKLENVVDDGQSVQKQDRLMIRFDLEGSGETSPRSGARAMLDLQFGNERFNREDPREKLNKRIHGVLLDDSGQPVLNRGGNTVPDHHFRAGVPSSLDDVEAFSQFAGSFLDELEQHRAPGAVGERPSGDVARS